MEKQGLRIALMQLRAVPGDQSAAWMKTEAACRAAARRGADLALFPEMWNIGYRFPDPGDQAAVRRWRDEAVTLDDPPILRMQGLAKELSLAIATTYLERTAALPRNAVTVIDRHGRAVLTYGKVHTCDFSDECLLAPGDGFAVATLDTAAGPVAVGAMICYDREFPESARVLMLKGAEIILVPNACPWDRHRENQLQSRAFENMVGIALANYASPDQNGRSTAIDGMAYGWVEEAQDYRARDMTLVQAGEEEGVFLGDFDLGALRAYRARETWGNAFRKPGRYAAMLDERVEQPFVRPESRR